MNRKCLLPLMMILPVLVTTIDDVLEEVVAVVVVDRPFPALRVG